MTTSKYIYNIWSRPRALIMILTIALCLSGGMPCSPDCGNEKCSFYARLRLIESIINECMVAPNIHKRILCTEDIGSAHQCIKGRIGRETDLRKPRFWTGIKVKVHQVWLRPERPQARRLESFPPFDKVVKALATAPRVNLQLKLADG